MINFFAQNKDVMDVLLQLVYLVVPVVISWLIRTYVRNSNYEKQVANIVRLSNAAIDYVENLEKRGDLVVPEGIKKGQQKLAVASGWLEEELNTNGIKVTTEEASRWISAEFQKRIGGVHTSSISQDVTNMAVDLIQGMLEGGNLVDLVKDQDKLDTLVALAADWYSARLSEQRGVRINRDEAETWIRAELLNRLQIKQLPSGDSLLDLARQSVAYVNGLKASGRLAQRSGAVEFDVDIAAAWMLTEALQLGMDVTPEEIANAVNTVIRTRKGME